MWETWEEMYAGPVHSFQLGFLRACILVVVSGCLGGEASFGTRTWAWAFHSGVERGAGSSGASDWPWGGLAGEARLLKLVQGRRAQTFTRSPRDGPGRNGPRQVCEAPGRWPLSRVVTSLDIKVGTHSPSRAQGPEPTSALPLEEASGQPFPLAQEMHITAIPKGLPYEL